MTYAMKARAKRVSRRLFEMDRRANRRPNVLACPFSRFATEKRTGGRRDLQLFPSRVLKILVGIFVPLCREEYIKLRPIQHFFPSRREKISSTPDKILSDPKWETRRGPRFGVVGSAANYQIAIFDAMQGHYRHMLLSLMLQSSSI